MIVEDIEYSDKYNLVKITISNEFFYISYDFFNDLALSLGAVIDFDLYKEILRENDFNRCKNEALKQLSYGAKTSFDLKKKLIEKKDKTYLKFLLDKKTYLENILQNFDPNNLRTKKRSDEIKSLILKIEEAIDEISN